MRLPELKLFRSRPSQMRQVMSTEWTERDQILEDDVNLFSWKREVDSQIQTYLEEAISCEVRSIVCKVSREGLKEQIEAVQGFWDSRISAPSLLFWEDVYFLSRDFLEFSSAKKGKLHLKIIKNDACAKFHIDGYHLRLFSTYYGEGTEWLPEEAVNRKALGTENSRIVKDPANIQRMEAFDVSIMKGQVPGSNNGVKGLVHRSPEISGSQNGRIILRIDI